MVCEGRFGRESDGGGIEKGRRVEEKFGRFVQASTGPEP